MNTYNNRKAGSTTHGKKERLKNQIKSMAQQLDPKEIVDFRELIMTNTILVDTMYQLLVQKGYFTEAEFLAKMKEVQVDYMKGENSPIHN